VFHTKLPLRTLITSTVLTAEASLKKLCPLYMIVENMSKCQNIQVKLNTFISKLLMSISTTAADATTTTKRQNKHKTTTLLFTL